MQKPRHVAARTDTWPRPGFSARVARNQALTGILLAAGGMMIFSVNDMAVKLLSGAYALHQVILIRALIGLCFILGFIWFSGTGFGQLRTRRPLSHLLRVVFLLASNVTYFIGLAQMPIADAVAVAFVSPIAITILSVIFLKETVGPRRWAAVLVGLVGVIIMLRPGTGIIQPAALLVLISAVLFAAGNLMSRKMRATESAPALGAFAGLGFVVISGAMGLWAGDGHLATDDPLWAFLLRPWIWPPLADWPIFLAAGLSVSIGGMMLTQAYRTAEAGLVAPFEYIGMPMAIFWGAVVFGTFPDLTAWAGIALICGAGLYTLWRETVRKQDAA